MITAEHELERFLDRRARAFEEALLELLDAHVSHNAGRIRSAEAALARLVKQAMTLADLNARKRLIMEADAIRRVGTFAGDPARPTTPNLTFDEALEDILTREPRVVPAGVVDRAAWVSQLYSDEHAFAAARSASDKLTGRVQKAIARLVRDGEATDKTEAELLRLSAEESHDWTRSYASVIYRTNVSNAYNGGRLQQAADPDVKEVIPALRVVGISDDRERPNHAAFRGLIAAEDDPIWSRARPPYGYNCRHGLAFVTRFYLERQGLLRADGSVIRFEPPGFADAEPDEGFRPGVF